MKPIRVIIALCIFAVFALNCLFAGAEDQPVVQNEQKIKIGYVNLSKTFDEYTKTQQYEKSLNEKSDKKKKERQDLVDEIKKLKDELILLSDKAKDEKQQAVDDKMKGLQDFDQTTRDELKEARDEMVRDILGEIDKIIQDYGKKNNFTVILNDRVLVYGDETIDITQDIIDILNKKGQ